MLKVLFLSLGLVTGGQILLVWWLAILCYRRGVVSGYGYRRDPADSRYSRAGAYLTACHRDQFPELRLRRGTK